MGIAAAVVRFCKIFDKSTEVLQKRLKYKKNFFKINLKRVFLL